MKFSSSVQHCIAKNCVWFASKRKITSLKAKKLSTTLVTDSKKKWKSQNKMLTRSTMLMRSLSLSGWPSIRMINTSRIDLANSRKFIRWFSDQLLETDKLSTLSVNKCQLILMKIHILRFTENSKPFSGMKSTRLSKRWIKFRIPKRKNQN